jgi:hypothetical protein
VGALPIIFIAGGLGALRASKDGLAAPFSSFAGRALRAHGERLNHLIASHASCKTCPIQFLHHTNHEGSGRGCPFLRASSDHILLKDPSKLPRYLFRDGG